MMCRVARWSLSLRVDDGRDPGPITARHLAGCAACQGYRRRLAAVDAGLRRGAASAPLPAPASRPRAFGLLAGTVLAVTVAFVGLRWVADGAPAAAPGAEPAVAPEADPERDPARGSLARAVASQVDVLTGEGPLEAELRALGADSRRGFEAVLSISGLD